jgi:hypothetical protein
MSDSEDTPKPSKRIVSPQPEPLPSVRLYQPYHSGFTDPPISTPAETPTAKAKLKTRVLPGHGRVSIFERMRTSFPPNRPTSYGLATTLITLAVSSAAGIPNPLHRTLTILLIALVLYFIGLKTQ